MRALVVLLAASALSGVHAADTESVESVTEAVYATISGPAGPRGWDRFRGLFIEGARLIVVRDAGRVFGPRGRGRR